MRAFLHLLLAQMREFSRDPMALVWTVMFPVAITLMIGLVFHDNELIFPVGVVNEAGTVGEPVLAALEAAQSLDVTVGTRAAETDALAAGHRRAVVIISPEVATVPAQLTVLYDPGHQSAPLVLGVLQQITVELNAQLADTPPALALAPEAIDAREFRRIDYMLPGVLAMALMELGLMVTAVQAVVRRERQILRRIGLTPVSRLTMITADVGFRLMVVVVELVVIAVLGWIVYDVPVRFERTLPVLGLALLGGAVFLVMGYGLAVLARTEESIHAIIALPHTLMLMLSGILFPIEDMPGWVQLIAGLLPITFLGDALRHQMIGMGSRYGLTTDIAVLVGWLVVCTALAVRWFKWEPQT